MKATGIVRRIDAGVIITPKPERPHKHWVSLIAQATRFSQASKSSILLTP